MMTPNWFKVNVEYLELNQDLYLITFSSTDELPLLSSGQFFMLQLENIYLNIPLAAYQNINANKFNAVIKVVGPGTELFIKTKPTIVNIFTPLGAMSPLVKDQTVLLVGGGTGSAILYELAKKLKTNNNKVIVCLAFKNKTDLFGIDSYIELLDKENVFVACQDKTDYFYGNILELISHYQIKFDFIYACGSVNLMRALDIQYPTISGYLIYETKMACGYGVCAACTILLKNGFTQRVCVNPNFKMHSIAYE